MNTRSKTKAKNAEKSLPAIDTEALAPQREPTEIEVKYGNLHTDLFDVKHDMHDNKFLKAINRLQVAIVTLSQLPPNRARSMLIVQMKDLTTQCLLHAPTSVLEQPMYEMKTLENGNRVRVEMVRFSVVGSNFDPMCLCSPCAQRHWCTVCAEIDPQKYTLRGLMAHNAIVFE
jgi:hypothetical protein